MRVAIAHDHGQVGGIVGRERREVVVLEPGHHIDAQVQLRIDLVERGAQLAHQEQVLVGDPCGDGLEVEVDAIEATFGHELGDALHEGARGSSSCSAG